MRLGVGEVLVVLALALLFFGPSKLPQLGSSLGQALKGFKKALNSLHDDVEEAPAAQERLPSGDKATATATRTGESMHARGPETRS